MDGNKKIRLTLTVKLLALFLPILVAASVLIGLMSYRTASNALTQNVYEKIDAVVTDVSHQIDAINKKHFTSIRFLANLILFHILKNNYK